MPDTPPTPADVIIEPGVRPAHRALAAAGYWEAFAQKLRYPLGPRTQAIAFIERVLDTSHAISAVTGTGRFLGVAGFKTPEGAFIGGTFADLRAVYGTLSASARAVLVSTLERDCEDGVLLMDGIFVAPDARGLGVGTALLQAIEDRARSAGLTHVRLDVIDTNPRARALYERRGFVPQAEYSIGLLRHLFGFSSATRMVKPLP